MLAVVRRGSGAVQRALCTPPVSLTASVSVPSTTRMTRRVLDDGTVLIRRMQAQEPAPPAARTFAPRGTFAQRVSGVDGVGGGGGGGAAEAGGDAAQRAPTGAEIAEMRALRAADPERNTVGRLARRFGVSKTTVRMAAPAPAARRSAVQELAAAARAEREARIPRNRHGLPRLHTERLRRELNAAPRVRVASSIGVASQRAPASPDQETGEIDNNNGNESLHSIRDSRPYDREALRRERGIAKITGDRRIDPRPIVIKTI
jgi:hypothetical protein